MISLMTAGYYRHVQQLTQTQTSSAMVIYRTRQECSYMHHLKEQQSLTMNILIRLFCLRQTVR